MPLWRVVTALKDEPIRRSKAYQHLSVAFIELSGQVGLLAGDFDLTPAGGGCSIWKKGIAERVGDVFVESVKP